MTKLTFPIGVLKMVDDGGTDEKVIAVHDAQANQAWRQE
jgi:inorganic pyrophosphatase